MTMQGLRCLLVMASLVATANAFVVPTAILSAHTCHCHHHQQSTQLCMSLDVNSITRRSCVVAIGAALTPKPEARATEDSKAFLQEYEDFTKAKEGWSYRDVNPGKGDMNVQAGDRVVYDWSGYTIGYFGRPFQAKGGPQGGAFDKEIDYARTVVGSHGIVKGLESALVGMKQGGIRQVVVPYGELSYPADDASHERVGPKPTTFSGQRALNFVLDNPRVDRTMLFNVKVIRIDKPNGQGGFLRG